MERQESQGRERVYDTMVVFRASQSMVKELKRKAKKQGLNLSDFLRLKLIEILQQEASR
jgi:predicted DNA binding CopG/RHH family protein